LLQESTLIAACGFALVGPCEREAASGEKPSFALLRTMPRQNEWRRQGTRQRQHQYREAGNERSDVEDSDNDAKQRSGEHKPRHHSPHDRSSLYQSLAT
jgi:hypothetical protein